MAERKAKGDAQQQAFNMRSLLRLGLWGASASAALALTALTAFSTTGSRRLQPAMSQSSAETQTGTQTGGRTAEMIDETQRLSEAVRSLAADRDRLLARIAILERGLEDVTGATGHLVAPTSQETLQTSSTAAAASEVTQPRSAPETLAPAAAPNPGPTMSQVMSPSPPTRVANATPLEPVVEADPAKPDPEFGVDVGGATSFDGLRVLWNSTKRANASLFDGLNPLVVVRQSKTHSTDLRLIAGPLNDQDAATRLCATLWAARRYCQPVPFEGKELKLAATEPQRRPAATPPKPATIPQPRPTVRASR